MARMRSVRADWLAVALVAALAACGGNAADKADFNRRKAICDGLVTDPAAPSKTVSQIVPLFDAINSLGVSASPASCQPNSVNPRPFTPAGADDHCPYDAQVTCRVLVAYVALDQDLCNQGRCVYYCELRTPGDATNGPNVDAPICARRWVSGQ
jgi:hypothetical protein